MISAGCTGCWMTVRIDNSQKAKIIEDAKKNANETGKTTTIIQDPVTWEWSFLTIDDAIAGGYPIGEVFSKSN